MNQPQPSNQTDFLNRMGTEAALDDDFRLLRIYAYYRLLFSLILLLIFSGDFAGNILGAVYPRVFLYAASLYAFTNLITLFLLWKKQFVPHSWQIIGILLIDISAIAVMMHASEGMDIGYLMLICVAAGSIFLKGHTSLALAGFASLLVLLENILSNWMGIASAQSIFSAGVFGILLFGTAYAFGILSDKIRRSNLEALAQARQAAYLQKLSQLIVERMRTGILVISANRQIILVNRAARELLGLKDLTVQTIGDIPALAEQMKLWETDPYGRSPFVKAYSDGPEIRVNFAELEEEEESDTLIFIEDNRQLSQQAQQLKLASLGRLTASIAHEVRNPLGAISHAAQLLSESPDVTEADKRLGEIIKNHSYRVNHIIENVLELSRRRGSTPELVNLADWLPVFAREYHQTKDAQLDLVIHQDSVKTRADLSQLHQVLTNLCDNGMRYSREHTGKASVTVESGIDLETDLPYIEVIDEGQGIPADKVEQVFEPFFTTESTGSGLGLYISRELCEANQATLDYKRTEEGMSCFRITLAHPERIF